MHASKRLYSLAEMQKFDISQILKLVRKLSLLDGFPFLLAQQKQFSIGELEQPLDLSQIDVGPFLANLQELGEFLLKAELVVTKGFVDNIADILKKPFLASSLAKAYQQLHATLQVEIDQKHFFYMSGSEKILFQPEEDSPIFGNDVRNKFTSALFEIDEAAKCLALERSTAAVFHLMRVMEVGVYAASRCLSIPDPIRGADKNWGKILQKIRDERNLRNSATPKRWASFDDDAYFLDIYATLDTVKNAWRNTTMHVANKYTVEEAQNIFVAVRVFMMKLAKRMDEHGLPLA